MRPLPHTYTVNASGEASAVASCFVLTFRAVARASKFEWSHLECRVEGTLERIEGITQFTRLVTHATLGVRYGKYRSVHKGAGKIGARLPRRQLAALAARIED